MLLKVTFKEMRIRSYPFSMSKKKLQSNHNRIITNNYVLSINKELS